MSDQKDVKTEKSGEERLNEIAGTTVGAATGAAVGIVLGGPVGSVVGGVVGTLVGNGTAKAGNKTHRKIWGEN